MQNIAQTIVQKILSVPNEKVAYVDHKLQRWSYGQFAEQIYAYTQGIDKLNLPSDRQIVCIAPLGFRLLCLILACFTRGLTVVFVDPNLGLKNFFKITRSLQNVSVVHDGMLPFIFILKIIFKNLSFYRIKIEKDMFLPVQNLQINDFAFNTENPWLMDGFTSGTTGQMKRIQRRHENLIASSNLFNKNIVHLDPDLHLVGYTLSVVRNLIDGGTAYEVTHEFKDFVQFFEESKINRLSGPPSLLYRVIRSYEEQNKKNESIKNIVIGGAPAQRWLLEKSKKYFPQATLQNIYGCTECEPISVTHGEEILNYQGEGYYVGRPVESLQCVFKSVAENLYELIVSGPQVTKAEGHNTKDLVRKVSEKNDLVLVGRADFLIRNDREIFFGQYEIETFIEGMHPMIQKAAVLNKEDCLYVYVQLFKSNEKILATGQDTLKMAIVEKLKDHFFSKMKIEILQTLPYDRRHRWKVQYTELLQRSGSN